MTLLHYNNSKEIQLARWVARGLSLLFIGFILVLLVSNEDFRNSPTPPTTYSHCSKSCPVTSGDKQSKMGIAKLPAIIQR